MKKLSGKSKLILFLVITVAVILFIVGFNIIFQNISSGQKQSDTSEHIGLEEDHIQETPNKTKTFTVFGKEVQEGVPFYNPYNPKDCMYSIFLSCETFENGCNNDNIMDFCEDQCYKTNGRLHGTGAYLQLKDQGVAYAIQCSCNQCLPSETGEEDFEFVSTKTTCRDISNKNGIEVVIKNIGETDISKNDWIVHKIDGQKVDVWPFDIKVSESGSVFTVVSTKDNDYSSGEHTIEIGLSQEKVKTTKVYCP